MEEKKEMITMEFLCWLSDQEAAASGEEKEVLLCI